MLNQLINDPKVLYIYEVGIQVYGLFPDTKDRDFIIICDNNYIPEIENLQGGFENVFMLDDPENGSLQIKIIGIDDWFERVLNGDLLA